MPPKMIESEEGDIQVIALLEEEVFTLSIEDRVARQRKLFDNFCKKHGIKKTRGGSWIVYKGTTYGYSPNMTRIPLIHSSYKNRKTMTARDYRGAGSRCSSTLAKSPQGGKCCINDRHECCVGIHFCFTPRAAFRWGVEVYELHIPPSAIVCVSRRVRTDTGEADIWALSLQSGDCKARASRVKIIRKLSEDEVRSKNL